MARSILAVEHLSDRIAPAVGAADLTAIGSNIGATPSVTAYNPDGSARFQVQPYPASFTGGVRVAVGDVNGDGTPDVVVAPGPGTSPVVKVFSGIDGTQLATFSAFEASFQGGVYVAVGDINRDGAADIILTPDQGGGPRVRVLSGRDQSVIADFLGIDDPNFRGGARTAVGDVNGDGVPALVVAAGFGGGPRIAVFDGQSISAGGNQLVRVVPDFFAFEPSLRNGAYVAAGDLNGDGHADLIFGGGPGGAPRVLVVSGAAAVGNGPAAAIASPLANFFAGDPSNRDGVRVATGDPAATGSTHILTAGPGGAVGVYTVDGRASSGPWANAAGGFVASAPAAVTLGLGTSPPPASPPPASPPAGLIPAQGIYDITLTGTTYQSFDSFPGAATQYMPLGNFDTSGVLVVAPTVDNLNASNNGLNGRDVAIHTGDLGLGGAGTLEYATNMLLHRLFNGNSIQLASIDMAFVNVNENNGTISFNPDARIARLSNLNAFYVNYGPDPKQILGGEVDLQFSDGGRRVSGTVTFVGAGMIAPGARAIQGQLAGVLETN